MFYAMLHTYQPPANPFHLPGNKHSLRMMIIQQGCNLLLAFDILSFHVSITQYYFTQYSITKYIMAQTYS